MNQKKGLQPRPPIVAVLGQVDHGKTTLLDKIRKTDVQRKEAGGITQGIGASTVTTKGGKRITFIDTPGHAAFSQMRSRGAGAADLAILVVAVGDGVKPQTLESLKYIRESKIPFIVALTKIDLPSASNEIIIGQLEKEKVLFEGRGGDTPIIEVSGKTGKGIEDLLEMIILVAEVSGIEADSKGELEGLVIETAKEKAGPLVSVVITDGTLNVGQEVVAGGIKAKVKGLFNDQGKRIKEVLPGEPARVLGFRDLPPVGSEIKGLKKETSVEELKPKEARNTLVGEVGEGQIFLLIKARSQGSLEALLASLPPEAVVVSSGVGEVNDSDILLAKNTEALIIAFESKASSSVRKFSKTEGVEIERFEVIYDLLKKVEEVVESRKKEVLGEAEIVASFPFNKKKVAGCKIISGKISKSDTLVLTRKGEELGKVKATSLKKQKQKVIEAKQGEECGIIFEPQLDFAEGDMLVSVRQEKKVKNG